MKYRKLPVIIEAVQFIGFDGGGTAIFDYDKQGDKMHEPSWVWGNWQNGSIYYDESGHIGIKTLEGNMPASFGDYIIKGVNGEIYPCKPDIFLKTYEKVSEEISQKYV
jgi:hypothetical protein